MSSRSRSPSVSVVVTAHNEGANLHKTVHYLLGTLPRDSEVLVVDDCSTDDSCTSLATGYSSVRVLRARERLGVSRARNVGAEQAEGQIVVFSDAHCEFPYGWVDEFRSTLEDPGVGIVGPGAAALGMAGAQGFGLTWADPTLRPAWLPRSARGPYAVPLLCGFLLALRRDVLVECGGFDEGLVGWGSEDHELCIRLWLLGYECRVVPDVLVAHLFRSTFPYAVDAAAVLHNVLRTAAVHFSQARVAYVLSAVRDHVSFPEAMSRMLASDYAERRAGLEERRTRDDGWFFQNFEIDSFDVEEKEVP